jgi:hypothetical protein
MPTMPSSVTITEGLPPESPWVIDELDTNIRNYLVGILANKGASEGAKLARQTQVLVEQTSQLENLQEFTVELGAGTRTAVVMNSSGSILISDPKIVSDLVGRTASSLTPTEVNRLIEFTANLAKSDPPVNLGGQTYVKVDIGVPPDEEFIQVPLRVWSSNPDSITDVQPFVCYAYADASGKLFYRICNENKVNLKIVSVAELAKPDVIHVYDAYRIGDKVFQPQDIIGAFPTKPNTTGGTLFRNVITGQLRLATDTGFIDNPDATGFVIPANQAEMTYWFGQAAAARLISTEAQLASDDIQLPVEPDSFQWKYKDTNISGGGYAIYPPVPKAPTDKSLVIGNFVQDPNDSQNRIYLITGKAGTTNIYVEVEKVGDPFVLQLTKDDLVNIRGQYTEKITLMTQRTTEQQLFINSILQRHNLYFDAATNAFKALADFSGRLANLI